MKINEIITDNFALRQASAAKNDNPNSTVDDSVHIEEDDEDTLNPPSIDVGDEVKVGKFRNVKAIVKGFKKDDHNQPVLKTNKGDKKLFSLRLSKLQTEKAPPGREKQVKALKGKVKNPYAVAWASYNKSK